MGATSKIAHTDNTERSVAIAMRQVRPVFSSVQIDKKVPSRSIRVPEEWPVRTQKMATRRLLPVSWSAQRSEWIQIVRWMIADQIDGPCAEQDTRRRNGNNRGTDHDGAPFIGPGIVPGAAGAFPLPAMVKFEECPSGGCDPHHNWRLPVGLVPLHVLPRKKRPVRAA